MYSVCEPVSEDGYPYVRWIHFIFGTCIYGNQEAISFIFGLSLYFLLNWLLGDLANFAGCILTNQLPFQMYLAGPLDEEVPLEPDDDPRSSKFSMTSLRDSILEGAKKSYTFPELKKGSHKRISSMVFVVLLLTFHSTSITKPSLSSLPINHVKSLDSNYLTLNDPINTQIFIGRIMAWSCTVLYLTSRMPQIWKNYTRRSVEGLSIFMFIFAALGNLTYTLCIFTNPLVSKNSAFLHEVVPYILGSVGTLSFDTVVFIQWLAWRDPERRKFRRRSQNYSDCEIEYQQVPSIRSNQ
ncbi:13154_t:CDS:2 [Cetraspora pellucida]|uniref:13154_t:CDS:1 n=1 Tax=Cetraspora pellucida TaxID=1433469 RepID=A0A9N9CG54_9GLOM|nr:13154_t:CDS:2 [Cetraspora pellucida]